MEQQIGFDFNEVLEQFKSGKNLTGKDGLLAPLIKQITKLLDIARNLLTFRYINHIIFFFLIDIYRHFRKSDLAQS